MGQASTSFCTSSDVQPLLDALFPSLGGDCTTYASLFSLDAQYFHQHDGFRNGSMQLFHNCQNYGKFCPTGQCQFIQDGEAILVVGSSTSTRAAGLSSRSAGESPAPVSDSELQCFMLVPYLWAEIPTNQKIPNNMEPHTGWEYIVAIQNSSSPFGYTINLFAEHETTYSVAFNWANPADSSNYFLTVDLLNVTASRGECNLPVSSVLEQYFGTKNSTATDLWRQQGNAVLLAAGGICHVAAPWAREVHSTLQSGITVFTLMPDHDHDQSSSSTSTSSRATSGAYYVTSQTVDFVNSFIPAGRAAGSTSSSGISDLWAFVGVPVAFVLGGICTLFCQSMHSMASTRSNRELRNKRDFQLLTG